jgi:nucleoid-associated protein YgaU
VEHVFARSLTANGRSCDDGRRTIEHTYEDRPELDSREVGMAALVGSAGGSAARSAARGNSGSLRLVGGASDCGSPLPAPAGRRAGRRRRPATALATFLALAGLWVGAGALRSTEGAAPGGGEGVVYVARPGDTLWAIAARLDPAGDPVEVVATLAAELHGAPLRPGAVLTVP